MGYSPRRGYKESASTLHIQLECYFIYIDGEEGIGCIVGDLLSWPKRSDFSTAAYGENPKELFGQHNIICNF